MKRKSSPKITAELASKIKYLVGVLGLYQHQAAAILNINQGRVSEVMAGKRYATAQPCSQMAFDF